ncbi:hypothetical protein LWI29_015084 [Acer saccharum]|uniref:Uncharacterized protein n=1 Tax=Acer saccharum TaxID=4024 RepID=A0AA39VQR8_ACESA|nr:hypothetical protein LWI29_015084 [Acer saccharum]KAK1569332.1 hypothetical protein Q3G72_035544 [Acer saccharum]
MAAFYVDEEEVWKCPKHPSKRYRSGICPTCLRDRLSSLCPDCATVRPCACRAITTSSSSSSSSSFSRFSFSGRENFGAGLGSVGRLSNLIESEPAFRRSRSVAVPLVGSKSKLVDEINKNNESRSSRKTATASFWWWLKGGKREGDDVEVEEESQRRVMMRKSRSVAVTTSDYGKSKGGTKWYFPSPIKAFRHTRLSKVIVQQRSPMYRG